MGEVLEVACALAAVFIPMGFAWFAVSRTARRHAHGKRRPPKSTVKQPVKGDPRG